MLAVPSLARQASAAQWIALVISGHISEFLRTVIRSVWGLDLLTIFKKAPDRDWNVEALTRELRGSIPLVRSTIEGFERCGLVLEGPEGIYRYAASPELDAMVTEVLQMYSERPVSVIREIALAPNETIHAFVDAFRLKKE
jgi:hypothetical protein